MSSGVKNVVNFGDDAGGNPIGTIIAFMGTSAPSGYLACDGTVYNIEDYPDLSSFFMLQFNQSNYFGGDGETTFAVPDLRAEFLRGTGTNGNASSGGGAEVGVHQIATRHAVSAAIMSGTGSPRTAASLYSPTNSARINSYDFKSGAVKLYGDKKNAFYSDPTYRTYYTDRPTNTAVLYCIKF